MIPYGNVDSENGGAGQAFPMTAVPSAGNVQSDTAPINNALGYGRSYGGGAADNPMQYYFELGQQLLQQQAMLQQQMQAQQPQQPFMGMGGGSGNFDLGSNPILTAGFDPNWLSQRLAAGSANGATIGGGGGMGGGMSAGGGYNPIDHPESRIRGSNSLKNRPAAGAATGGPNPSPSGWLDRLSLGIN